MTLPRRAQRSREPAYFAPTGTGTLGTIDVSGPNGEGTIRIRGGQVVVEDAGGRVVNRDRMWHYTEGLRNWNPIWANHGIRILPGPSSLWLDPTGRRLPFPHIPGASSLDTLRHITTNEWPYTWFVLNRAIIKREFGLANNVCDARNAVIASS